MCKQPSQTRSLLLESTPKFQKALISARWVLSCDQTQQIKTPWKCQELLSRSSVSSCIYSSLYCMRNMFLQNCARGRGSHGNLHAVATSWSAFHASWPQASALICPKENSAQSANKLPPLQVENELGMRLRPINKAFIDAVRTTLSLGLVKDGKVVWAAWARAQAYHNCRWRSVSKPSLMGLPQLSSWSALSCSLPLLFNSQDLLYRIFFKTYRQWWQSQRCIIFYRHIPFFYL